MDLVRSFYTLSFSNGVWFELNNDGEIMNYSSLQTH